MHVSWILSGFSASMIAYRLLSTDTLPFAIVPVNILRNVNPPFGHLQLQLSVQLCDIVSSAVFSSARLCLRVLNESENAQTSENSTKYSDGVPRLHLTFALYKLKIAHRASLPLSQALGPIESGPPNSTITP